ncbi:hypothetical protein AVEN_202588-1 [Araneus ventricosus]|uniref:Uncharacterized protein n=1 Tax=Araneus ventricosus TaxID=182803 RepID=A0A4Y2QMT1_ARAVE|nr:hypothetical protein AVEN_202588-1 [Araneus ventricosus]
MPLVVIALAFTQSDDYIQNALKIPRSPDITPLDFYLWGYVKQHVYSERISDINHLKQRITDVINSATPDVLTRVWEELDYRLDVCRATNGAHIELR